MAALICMTGEGRGVCRSVRKPGTLGLRRTAPSVEPSEPEGAALMCMTGEVHGVCRSVRKVALALCPNVLGTVLEDLYFVRK